MPFRLSPALVFGAALLSFAAAASAAEPAPKEEMVLGFTRAQVASVTYCYGRATFALGAFLDYGNGRKIEEAKAAAGASGQAADLIREEIDKVYSAKPKVSARSWTEARFVECLAGKSVPVPAQDAVFCYDLSFWLALMVRTRMQDTREATVDAIVAKDGNPAVRDVVGAEYDSQKKGDQQQSAMYTVGSFLQCVNLRREKAQAAAK